MTLRGSVVAVTGGAHGLGRSLVRRFVRDGARVAVLDIDDAGARALAVEVGALAVHCDTGNHESLDEAIQTTVSQLGPIDVFCSNAGVGGGMSLDSSDDEWLRLWNINTMAHVWAARAVIPSMLDRGGGRVLQVVSGSALNVLAASPAYTTTKRAALAFSEWLAITYGPRGIAVSCFCPMGMRTPMLMNALADIPDARSALDSAMEPDEAADIAVDGMLQGKFLILSHPFVMGEHQLRAQDYDRWLALRQADPTSSVLGSNH